LLLNETYCVIKVETVVLLNILLKKKNKMRKQVAEDHFKRV